MVPPAAAAASVEADAYSGLVASDDEDDQQAAVGDLFDPPDVGAVGVAPGVPDAAAPTPWNAADSRKGLAIHGNRWQLSAESAITGLELSHHLKSTITMADAVKLAVRLGCTPKTVVELRAQIDSGQVQIPDRRTCMGNKVRLDLLAMLYQRELLKRWQTWRYIQTDGSPLKGWNFLNTRADELSFPIEFDDRAILEALQHGHFTYRRRTMVLLTMGYGKTSLVDKIDTFGMQLQHDSRDSEARFNQFRSEVEGLGTDQSTEHLLADAPNLIGDKRQLKASIDRVLHEEIDMSSAEFADSRLLPNAVLVTDALHIMFKGMEYALKKSPCWTEIEDALRHIANFLRDRMLRWRFRSRCCPNAAISALFKSWSSAKVDWDYEFLEKLLGPLTEIIDLFIEHFCEARMQLRNNLVRDDTVEDSEDRKAEIAQKIKKCAAAIEVHHLALKTWAFLFIAKVVGNRARWFEGCDCHAHIWQLKVAHKRKYDIFQSENTMHTCVWKAKRATHMALGEINKIQSEIMDATSAEYERRLRNISADDRAYMVGCVQEIKDGLVEFYTAKFFYFLKLPWSVAAIDGARIGNWHGAVARAKVIVSEIQAMELNGTLAKAHRKSVALWTSHKHALIAFSRGEVKDELEHPRFMIFVKKLALLLTATRWVEQAHAVVKNIMDVSSNITPAMCSANLRFAEHIDQLLSDPLGRAFVAANFYTRNFLFDRFGYAGLWRGMEPVTQLQKIYSFDPVSQFAQNPEAIVGARRFAAAAKAVGDAPFQAAVSGTVKLAIDYLRSVLQEGVVFSLPTEVINLATTTVGMAASCLQAPMPTLVSDILVKMTALVALPASDKAPKIKHDDSRVFRVVKVEPHKRFEMPIGGVAKLSSLIHVRELNVKYGHRASLQAGEFVGGPLAIDLERVLDSLKDEVVDKLRVWAQPKFEAYPIPLGAVSSGEDNLAPIQLDLPRRAVWDAILDMDHVDG